MLAEILEDPEVKAEFNAQPEHQRIAKIAHAMWVESAHKYQVPPPLERRSGEVLEATHLFQQSHQLVAEQVVLAIAYLTHLVF